MCPKGYFMLIVDLLTPTELTVLWNGTHHSCEILRHFSRHNFCSEMGREGSQVLVSDEAEAQDS